MSYPSQIASTSSPKTLQHVLVIEDEHGKRVVHLRSATASIGRDVSNSIVLHSHRISRQHAILLRTTIPGNSNHQFRIIDGNLQGKRSTNGMKVNGIVCTSHDLQHGDQIVFGGEVRTRYYTAINAEDIEYLTNCETDDLSGFLQTLHNPRETISGYSMGERQAASEVAIARLASFPELFIHPIIEINLGGEITYLNPAAAHLFPNLQILQTQHPIIAGIINSVATTSGKRFVREITINDHIYEQSIHAITESDLIRMYLVDITERKRTERKFLESQALLQHAFDYTPIGMALVSPEGHWLKVNDALTKIVGYSEAELLNMTFHEITHSKYVKLVMARTRKLLSGEISTYQIEKQYVHKQGDPVWVQSSVSLVRNHLGEPEYFITQIQDISDRQASKEALQKTTMLQTGILESTSHAVISTGIDGKITTFNAAAENMLGYRADEIIGQKTPLFFHHTSEVKERLHMLSESEQIPEQFNISRFLQNIHKDEATSKEWIYVRKDQSQFPVELSVTTLQNNDQGTTGFLVTAQDITQRKQVEKALKQAHDDLELRVKERTQDLQLSNQKLQAEIVERMNAQEEVNFLQKITQKISEAQDLLTALKVALELICETTGWDFGESWIPHYSGKYLESGSAWHHDDDIFHSLYEQSKAMTFAPHEGLPGRVWETQQPEWIYDISNQPKEIFRRNDLAAPTELVAGFGIPVIDNQKVVAVLVFFMKKLSGDQIRQVNLVSSVTLQIGSLILRKKTEGALRSSLATNTALVKALPDWMFRISLNGTIVNSKAAKHSIVPLLSKDFRGKNLKALLPEQAAQDFLTAIATAKMTQNLEVVEYSLNHGDETYQFEARLSLGEENEIISIIRDITERKKSEAKIHSALKREKELNELKTRFVSMASHEFRTPLATILASAELLEHYRHKWSEEKNLSHLHRIQGSTQHMTELLNDVLLIGTAEAGKLEFKPMEVDIVKFSQDLVEELQLSTHTHTIHFESTLDQAIVRSDQKLLRQMFYNLLSNAIKYSPGKENVYFSLDKQADSVAIQIKDEGIGIPKNDISKVFNAFDRASNVGNISGTGLGLPIVKKAVDMHGGTIMLDSDTNQGSTFLITLPLASVAQPLAG